MIEIVELRRTSLRPSRYYATMTMYLKLLLLSLPLSPECSKSDSRLREQRQPQGENKNGNFHRRHVARETGNFFPRANVLRVCFARDISPCGQASLLPLPSPRDLYLVLVSPGHFSHVAWYRAWYRVRPPHARTRLSNVSPRTLHFSTLTISFRNLSGVKLDVAARRKRPVRSTRRDNVLPHG